jgi:hypothetical protein
VEEILPSSAPAAKKMVDEMNRRTLAGYEAILSAGVEEGSLRPARPAYLLLAVIGMCEFFTAGIPILRLASGKKLDEQAEMKEYRDFICDLVLNGLAKKARE